MEPEEYTGTRILTSEELSTLSQPLLNEVQNLLEKFSGGDAELLWALRRKLVKQLQAEEKGRQRDIRELKAYKRGEQRGKCARCSEVLPEKGAVLDRFKGMIKYSPENTRLLCPSCDRAVQAERGYR